MEDLDVEKWIKIARTNPILLAMGGGLLIGIAVTQLVKSTWLAFGDTTLINKARYRVTCMWLAVVTTFLSTHYLWNAIIPTEAPLLNKTVSLGMALTSPLMYRAIKAALPEKYAKVLGDNGAFEDGPTNH